MSTKQAYYKKIDEIRAKNHAYKVEEKTISHEITIEEPKVRPPVRRQSGAIFMNNLIKTQMQDFKNQYQHLNEMALKDEHFKLAVPKRRMVQPTQLKGGPEPSKDFKLLEKLT